MLERPTEPLRPMCFRWVNIRYSLMLSVRAEVAPVHRAQHLTVMHWIGGLRSGEKLQQHDQLSSDLHAAKRVTGRRSFHYPGCEGLPSRHAVQPRIQP